LVEADTIVHLIGVAHPSPSKALEFERVDLGSVRAMLSALHRASAGAPQTDAGNPKHAVRHIVYLSVARPAPVMLAYQRVREEAEALITSSGIAASFLRPWYVLGPGHRWPLLLLPLYWLLAALPSTRASAQRLGLVSLRQMVNALVEAVESPPQVTHIVDVPAIRRAPAT
jgi:uncharacterized protein YbjT (DUF2867 family)